MHNHAWSVCIVVSRCPIIDGLLYVYIHMRQPMAYSTHKTARAVEHIYLMQPMVRSYIGGLQNVRFKYLW